MAVNETCHTLSEPLCALGSDQWTLCGKFNGVLLRSPKVRIETCTFSTILYFHSKVNDCPRIRVGSRNHCVRKGTALFSHTAYPLQTVISVVVLE